MTIQQSILKKTALHSFHKDLKAKMISFAGFSMPIQYPTGILTEHIITRSGIGLFDISHMGQVDVEGPRSTRLLEKIIPSDLFELKNHHSTYSCFTLNNGGILDDLIITRLQDTKWRLVLNASRTSVGLEHLLNYTSPESQVIHRKDLSLIAIQGPQARQELSKIIPEAKNLRFLKTKKLLWNNAPITLFCSGYSGEDGFEISIPNDLAELLANQLTNLHGSTWVGLGARNSLRLEAGLNLYGNDLNEGTTPVEANISFIIGKRRRKEGGFLGSEKILSQLVSGSLRNRVGIASKDGRTILREGTLIFNSDQQLIGEVSSGGFGPSINKPVAMGYIAFDKIKSNEQFYAKVRGKQIAIALVSYNFIKALKNQSELK